MSFDPHRFGRTAAVDIGGALFAVDAAAREKAVARANAEATAQCLDLWEAELADRDNRIENLLLAREMDQQLLRAQQVRIAALEADNASYRLQLQDALTA
jgi:hypothetical protein